MTLSDFRKEVDRRIDAAGGETLNLAVYPVAIFYLAAWFALLAGLGEVLFLFVAEFFLHRYIYYWGPHLLWMTPLANLFIFSIPATVLFILASRWKRFAAIQIPVTVYAFLTFLSWLWLYTQLDKIAAAVFAAGLATAIGRLVGAHPALVSALVRWTFGWPRFLTRLSKVTPASALDSPEPAPVALTRRQFLVSTGTMVTGLALGAYGWQVLDERRAFAALPAGSPSRPNVLLVVLDTVRAQNLSLYGYDRATTPQLQRLAQRGVRFQRAVSTASWTLPAHASMFTGHYPQDLSVGYASGLDASYPTLAQVLSANGYDTAGFVSNIWYCSRESGLNRGFAHYEDFGLSVGQILNSSSLSQTLAENEQLRRAIGFYQELGRKPAPEMNADFLRWHSQRDTRRPFFAFINYFDAHEPYLPPEPFAEKFGSIQQRQNPRHNVDWKWSPEQIKAELNAYDGSIAYLDDQLGQLFDELERRHALDNTLVVIASDHGEEFNEHGIVDHGYSLYWPVIHVLLTMSFPGRLPAGLSVQAPVTMRDLPATILDIIGLQGQSAFPGGSLARHWNGSNAAGLASQPLLSQVAFNPGYPQWYPVAQGDVKSLTVENYHYIRIGEGREQLFDLDQDPWEQQDLATTPNGARRTQEFRQSLDTLMRATADSLKNRS